MKSSTLVRAFGIAIFSLLAVACTGGSSSRVGKVKTCGIKHDPMSTTDKMYSGTGVPLKPGDPVAFAPGDYAYQGSQVYYEDLTNDIKFHFIQSVSANGTANVDIVCVGGRGLGKDTPKIENLMIPVVSDMQLDENGRVQIRERVFRITFDPAARPVLKAVVDVIDQDYVEGSPADTYPEYNEENVQRILGVKDYPNIYHLVSRLRGEGSQKVGDKNVNVIVRALVNWKKVTPDERKGIDDKLKNPGGKTAKNP